MTETDTSREEMLPIPSPEKCANDLHDDGFHPEAACVERLMREASYHQQEIDTLINRIRQEQSRAEKAEAERNTAWNDAIEAACDRLSDNWTWDDADFLADVQDDLRRTLKKGDTP